MARAHSELPIGDLASLAAAWPASHDPDEERLPLRSCALVIGGLSAGLWTLAWLALGTAG